MSSLVINLFTGVLVASIGYAFYIGVRYFNCFDKEKIGEKCVFLFPTAGEASIKDLKETPKNNIVMKLYFVKIPFLEITMFLMMATAFISIFVVLSLILNVFEANDNIAIVLMLFIGIISGITYAQRTNCIWFAKKELKVEIKDLL